MIKNRDKILILGGYSHANRGDHGMIEGLISFISKYVSHDKIIIFYHNADNSVKHNNVVSVTSPELFLLGYEKYMAKLYSIIRGICFVIDFLFFLATSKTLINLMSVLRFYQNLTQAKVLFIHGSGSFNSIWWRDWVYPKTFCIICARIIRVPVIITGQGIGPIDGILDKLIAKVAFRCSTHIGVRDGNQSFDEISKLLTDTSKVAFSWDDSLIEIKKNDEATLKAMYKEGIPKNINLVGVNIRNTFSYNNKFGNPDYATIANLLDNIINKHKCHVVFLPISYDEWDDDRASAKRIVENMKHKREATIITGEHDYIMLHNIAGMMLFNIGTSYHFQVFSLHNNVPSIGIYSDNYYKQKLEGLYSIYEMLNYCFKYDLNIFNEVESTIDILLNDIERIRNHIYHKNTCFKQMQLTWLNNVSRAVK